MTTPPTQPPAQGPAAHTSFDAPEFSVVGVPTGGPDDMHPDKLHVYQNGVLVVVAIDDEPAHGVLCEIVKRCNTHAAHLARINVLESLLTGGIELIAAERERQISQEGWTPEHDDQHRFAEIAQNAALLVVNGTDASVDLHGEAIDWGLTEKHKGNRIRQLTIAGALIAAEIDRLNRAALTPSQEGPV